MKYLAVILTIYFLSLNLIPCSDSGDSIEGSANVTMVDLDNHNGDNCDLCSPFCQCHCCHTHTVVLNKLSFDPLPKTFPKKSFSHFDSLGKELPFYLFQPPRV